MPLAGACFAQLGLRLLERGEPLPAADSRSNWVCRQRIARLGLPTVFVQEGGYLSDALGGNLTAVLGGFQGVR